MPIYEYEALDSNKACRKCLHPFEFIQNIDDNPISRCPDCGQKVRRVISWCRAAVLQSSEVDMWAKKTIKAYEKNGMWSHAAELADKQAEKIKDRGLKTRALENYKKAGYDADALEKHMRTKND